MTVARASSPPVAAPWGRVPPLQLGDHLTRDEFERRYDATPNLKKAELLEGVGFMPPSPVFHEFHSAPHFDLIGWLGQYRAVTPGIRGGDNGHIRLDLDNEPQPDAYLFIDPACGGQVRISADGYVEGPPEFVAEVAASSASHDLHLKKRIYRRNGVREYVVWRVFDQVIDWFALRGSEYVALSAGGAEGILKSEVLPGLWLDPAALIRGDLASAFDVLRRGLSSPEHGTFKAKLGQGPGRPR